jgi:hypothetical protein
MAATNAAPDESQETRDWTEITNVSLKGLTGHPFTPPLTTHHPSHHNHHHPTMAYSG